MRSSKPIHEASKQTNKSKIRQEKVSEFSSISSINSINVDYSHIQHSVAGPSFSTFENPLDSQNEGETPQQSVVFYNKAMTKITGLQHKEEFEAFV